MSIFIFRSNQRRTQAKIPRKAKGAMGTNPQLSKESRRNQGRAKVPFASGVKGLCQGP